MNKASDNMVSQNIVNFNPVRGLLGQSQGSELPNSGITTGGMTSSIEAQSQQAHNMLKGGDIRIPGLKDHKPGRMFGSQREESFDISCKSQVTTSLRSC